MHSYLQNAHQKHLVSVPNLRQRYPSKIYTGHKTRIIQRQRRPLYCSKPTSSASSSPINSASTSSPTQPSNSSNPFCTWTLNRITSSSARSTCPWSSSLTLPASSLMLSQATPTSISLCSNSSTPFSKLSLILASSFSNFSMALVLCVWTVCVFSFNAE